MLEDSLRETLFSLQVYGVGWSGGVGVRAMRFKQPLFQNSMLPSGQPYFELGSPLVMNSVNPCRFLHIDSILKNNHDLYDKPKHFHQHIHLLDALEPDSDLGSNMMPRP